MSRWLTRVALAALGCTSIAGAPPSADRVVVTSPRSTVRIDLHVGEGHLRYEVRRGGVAVIEPSRAGIVLDGIDLGESVALGAIDNYQVDGGNGARVTVIHRPSGVRYGMDIRAYDDGAAFRTIVPGAGSRVPDGAATFTLPAGSAVRSPTRECAAALLVATLPAGGYLGIDECDVGNYAGMVLQSEDNRIFRERLTAHATIEGRITTPWRVIVVATDEATLIKSEIVRSLPRCASER